MSSTTKDEINQNIILPAWKLIQKDSKAKKFYVLPGILSIIFLSGVLVYQSIYTYVEIFGNKEKDFKFILKFFENWIGYEFIILLVLFLIVYFFLTPIFEAGLIKYIDLKNKGRALSKSEAFGQGIYKFLPMFEYNNFFSEFKILSILNFYLFTLRFLGLEYLTFVNVLYLGILIIGLFINIMFIYAKFFIILEDKGIFESIGQSSKLTILSLKKTIRLYFLMFILNLRVILNFIVFLFFPIFISIAISLITSKFLLMIAIAIISLIFIFLILFVGYLTAVLDIFKTGLWYYAYIDGNDLLEDKKNV